MSSLFNVRASLILFCVVLLASVPASANFTIVNGQIYTPGLAIVDAPQPFTPEGGDTLQVALDISGDGRLPLSPYAPNFNTGISNITIFLYSYYTGLNLTISNGTTAGWRNNTSEAPEFYCNLTTNQNFQNAGCQEIVFQEGGSTVKHVNWVWPHCFVGNGGAVDGLCGQGGTVQDCLDGTARGPYNISIHQTFRINGTGYYTIFDLPIQVTNSIPNTTQYSANGSRPHCDLRNNPLNETSQNSSTTPLPSQPYLGGNVTVSGNETVYGNQTVSGNRTGPGNENGGQRLFSQDVGGFHVFLVAAVLAFVFT